MAATGGQRVDKWLFFARVVKSRGLAQKLVVSGAVRVNREKIHNAARPVRVGDVLTITVAGRIRVLRLLDPGTRRGPASEARQLFEDMAPTAGGEAAAVGDAEAARPAGDGSA